MLKHFLCVLIMGVFADCGQSCNGDCWIGGKKGYCATFEFGCLCKNDTDNLQVVGLADLLSPQVTPELQGAEQPGALDIYLNTTSISNLMQTFVPLLGYFALNNKTFETNIHESTIFYELDLESIHIETISGFQNIEFEYLEGTDKLHVHMDGIQGSVLLNGSFKGLHFIPLDASKAEFAGASIDFTLESTSTD